MGTLTGGTWTGEAPPQLHWDSTARRYVEHDVSAMETFGPLVEQANDNLAVAEQSSGRIETETSSRARFQAMLDGKPEPAKVDARGPHISTLNGRFFPFDPRPDEVDIVHIAHSLAMSCRYTGACRRFYSTAEHSVHIARWLLPYAGPEVAMAGLLHDAPEALSGFGDTARPSKRKVPLIGSTEADIWKRAVAVKYALPMELPEEVHEADSRIIADEMTQNMFECDPSYNDPLGITLEYWGPEEARRRFLNMFLRIRQLRDVDTPWTAEDQADHDYQFGKEQEAA